MRRTSTIQRSLNIAVPLIAVLSFGVVGCTSDDAATGASPTTSTSMVTTSTTSTTAPPVENDFDVRAFVEAFSSDDLKGRDNATEGSATAQRMLLDELSSFAEPAFPDASGDDQFLQPVDGGANIVGIIPGGDLADEFVVIGAHYDHLGTDCRMIDDEPEDNICNGAADNATGVGVVLSVAKSIALGDTPRRTVIVGFWDREEDDFEGSLGYLDAPVAPLDATIAYVNFDIQGTNLLPTLANITVMVGSETGGPNLVASAVDATTASSLATQRLSLLFGQGRSDHAPFVDAGVPAVFFTDANNGCYHTTNDEFSRVDFTKLDQQILTATALMQDLVDTDTPPEFDPTASASNFADAESLLGVINPARNELSAFDSETRAAIEQYIIDLEAIVAAGPGEYDDADTGVVAGGAATLVAALAALPCVGPE